MKDITDLNETELRETVAKMQENLYALIKPETNDPKKEFFDGIRMIASEICDIAMKATPEVSCGHDECAQDAHKQATETIAKCMSAFMVMTDVLEHNPMLDQPGLLEYQIRNAIRNRINVEKIQNGIENGVIKSPHISDGSDAA